MHFGLKDSFDEFRYSQIHKYLTNLKKLTYNFFGENKLPN